MIWLLILIFLRIFFEWLPPSGVTILLLDLGVLGALIYIIRTNQVSRAIESWQFMRRRSQKRVKVQFNLALASDLLRLLALPFVTLWFLRWLEGFELIERVTSNRELAYVDVFIFCLALASLFDSDWFSSILTKAQMTSGRQVLVHYSVAVVIGAILLLLPTSLQDGQSLSLINSFFIAISALSVTGLSTVDITSVLSFSGMVILLVLIQLGGLGIVLITAGFSVATFNRLSLNSLLLGREMYNSCRVGDVPNFLARVVGITFFIELVGTVFIYFSLPEKTPDRLFSATFHSISAFCNAGFSIYSNNLQHPNFAFIGIATICVLIVLGGMGFPILMDLGGGLRKVPKGVLTPHLRLTVAVMAFLLVIGAVFFFVLESLRPSAALDIWQRAGQAVFYSISSRTAGFGLVPVEMFHFSALFWLVLLMAIGANPSSTGGGMKTTTIGVLLLAVYHTIRGSRQTVFFGRAVPTATIARALTVVVLYCLVSGVALTLLVITENASPFDLGFEVISALSTVGLSMGVTAKLSAFGKIVIMFLMLFGRIGILAILLAGLGHISPSRVRYPEDDFFVG